MPQSDQPSHRRGFTKSSMRHEPPENRLFADKTGDRLARQIRRLAWPERCRALDVYFARQAAELDPAEIDAMIAGRPAPPASASGRPAEFANRCRTMLTGLIQAMPVDRRILGPHQALTYLLARDWRLARAAAGWVGTHGMAPIAAALQKLPGYALVLVASGPEDGIAALLRGRGGAD